MESIKKYIPYLLFLFVIIQTVIITRSCSSNSDLRSQRKELNQKNKELNAVISNLHEKQEQSKEMIEAFKDSAKHSQTKIESLERKKSKVVYAPIHTGEVNTTDTASIVNQINEGRECCAKLVFADSIITELKRKDFFNQQTINNQDTLINRLRSEIAVVNDKLALKNEEVKLIAKEKKRIRQQRNVSILAGIVITALHFVH